MKLNIGSNTVFIPLAIVSTIPIITVPIVEIVVTIPFAIESIIVATPSKIALIPSPASPSALTKSDTAYIIATNTPNITVSNTNAIAPIPVVVTAVNTAAKIPIAADKVIIVPANNANPDNNCSLDNPCNALTNSFNTHIIAPNAAKSTNNSANALSGIPLNALPSIAIAPPNDINAAAINNAPPASVSNGTSFIAFMNGINANINISNAPATKYNCPMAFQSIAVKNLLTSPTPAAKATNAPTNPSIEVPIDKLYLGRSNCYIQVKVLSIFDLVQLYFLMDTNVFKEMLKNKNLLKTIKYRIIDIDSLGSFQYSDVIDNCSSTVSFDKLKICNFIISGVINKKIRMFVFNLNSSFKFIKNLPENALLF